MNKNELYFLPLGGSGEIGMNLNLYGYDGKWIILDLGVTFKHELGIEVVMPDPTFIVERRKDLVGIVCTHAHEDHIGAIPYLWNKLRVPIYATPFTCEIIRGKLKDAGLLGQAQLHEIPLSGTVKLDPFDIEFVTLTHSIPEPSAVAVKTPAGVVVHTGDWKIDPTPMLGEPTDVARLKALGDEGVLALTCDSTNVFNEGRTGSESDVQEGLEQSIRTAEGRVVIACFASNVARLQTIAAQARSLGRTVGLAGYSLRKMNEAARKTGYLQGTQQFEELRDLMQRPRKDVVIISTGSQGETRAGLSRMAFGEHPEVRLEAGDTVVFSSREIPGNEDEIRAIQKAFLVRGIHVLTAKDAHTHVSGHPSRDELKDMYDWVRPEVLLPVHGEEHHMQEQARFGLKCGIKSTIVPHNGSLIRLEKGKPPQHVETVKVGRWALDGNTIVPLTSEHLGQRRKAMYDGVVSITAIVDGGARLFAAPQVSLIGVCEASAEKDIIKEINESIEDALYSMNHKQKGENVHVKEQIQNAARRTLKRLRDKKSVLVVHVIRLKGKK